MRRINGWELLRISALLVWFAICLVIFIYYPGAVNHIQGTTLYGLSTFSEKLSRISPISYLADILISCFGIVVYSSASISLGIFLTGHLKIENKLRHSPILMKGTVAMTFFLVGNAAFSLVLLFVAAVSRLSPALSFVIISAGLLAGLFKTKGLLFSGLIPRVKSSSLLNTFTLSILILAMFQTSARISYDASAVYFSTAKLTAIDQQVGYYSDISFMASVLHSVIQFSAVIQIFGDQSARMIVWFFGVVNIIVAIALAERARATGLAKRIIPILIVTSTAFLDLMGDGKVDLISSAYSLIGVYWLTVGMDNSDKSRSFDLLSGFFIGFACILRPYNVFLLGIVVVVFLVQMYRSGQISVKHAVHHAAWMVIGAVGPVLYHLYINEAIFGSPFAFWDSVTYINPAEGPWDFQPELIWIQRLFYPVVVTFKNSGASLGNITPLILVFLPLLMVGGIRNNISIHQETLRLATSAGTALILWITIFFTVVEIRYVLFLWIILYIPFAELIASVIKSEFAFLKYSVNFVIALLMVFIMFRSLYISISTYSPVDRQNNPQCTDNVLCNHFAPINEMADQGERVLTLSAFRYYLRTDLFACSTTVNEYRTLRQLSQTDTDAFWSEVIRLGYTHVAFEKDYATRHLGLSDAPFTNPPEWLELTPILVASEELEIAAYALNSFNPPVQAEIVCGQDDAGIWRLKQR